MPHAFFGLTMAGCFALCAFGVLPADQFVDVAKWVTILYAASTTLVSVVRHVWPRPASPQFENLAVTGSPTAPWLEPEAQHGVEFLGPFGSLRDDVFSDAIGDGLPPNYTNMIRCHGAPPATTDGADGAPVTVPTESEPSLENLSGRRPIGGTPPLEYNQRPDLTLPRSAVELAARAAASEAADPNIVILGDPPKKEDLP